MEELITIGTFEVYSAQRERYVSGELWQDWYSKYPFLFDNDDYRLAENQAHLGYHFYEWLAAILVYHSTGYLSLVEKYQCNNHNLKRQVLKQFNSPILNQAISFQDNHKVINCPDLLVYAPDFSDWFFCEVKGGQDKIRETQKHDFRVLYELTRKPIRFIQFRLIKKM